MKKREDGRIWYAGAWRTPDLDKVQTAVVIGKQINELMKTKLDAVKQYGEMLQDQVEEE